MQAFIKQLQPINGRVIIFNRFLCYSWNLYTLFRLGRGAYIMRWKKTITIYNIVQSPTLLRNITIITTKNNPK